MPAVFVAAGCIALLGGLLAMGVVIVLRRARQQEIVMVKRWGEDGKTKVRFRGERWLAEPAPGTPLTAGHYRVLAFSAKRLVLEKA